MAAPRRRAAPRATFRPPSGAVSTSTRRAVQRCSRYCQPSRCRARMTASSTWWSAAASTVDMETPPQDRMLTPSEPADRTPLTAGLPTASTSPVPPVGRTPMEATSPSPSAPAAASLTRSFDTAERAQALGCAPASLTTFAACLCAVLRCVVWRCARLVWCGVQCCPLDSSPLFETCEFVAAPYVSNSIGAQAKSGNFWLNFGGECQGGSHQGQWNGLQQYSNEATTGLSLPTYVGVRCAAGVWDSADSYGDLCSSNQCAPSNAGGIQCQYPSGGWNTAGLNFVAVEQCTSSNPACYFTCPLAQVSSCTLRQRPSYVVHALRSAAPCPC